MDGDDDERVMWCWKNMIWLEEMDDTHEVKILDG